MSTSVPLNGRDLIGAVVTGLASSWYVDGPSGSRSLIHVWLLLDRGPVKLHTMSGVQLLAEPVDVAYALPDLDGTVVIEEHAGEPWDELVGATITRVARISPELGDDGWLFVVGDVQLAVMDAGDELIGCRWPDARWDAASVVDVA